MVTSMPLPMGCFIDLTTTLSFIPITWPPNPFASPAKLFATTTDLLGLTSSNFSDFMYSSFLQSTREKSIFS
uniref:Uncharacterized protein n=1 Tax=Rhizophora mucronata TaxID=61149 RepID=A0A2P2NUQ1_RHIMU